MALSSALAKALFDNAAESPEELAFRKGDILMVLEQEGSGPGWWLCSLHGRQGIAPANRLRLLNTCPAPEQPAEPRSEDAVYLSPGPLPRPALPDPSDVYLSPPAVGSLRRVEGRPRSHSGSGPRPRPEWESVTRSRSPSLRGRGSESALPKQTLYQTPRTGPVQESLYLVPREAAPSGNSDGCYLVPRVSTTSTEDVYQTPTAGTAEPEDPRLKRSNVPPSPGLKQESSGVYQTPSGPHRQAQSSPRPLPKTPVNVRGKLPQAHSFPRNSPILVRARVQQGSPGFARKPPPPAPPVRGVSRKDVNPAPQQAEGPKVEAYLPKNTKETEEGEYEEPDDKNLQNQVYDTPPTSRWQQAVPKMRPETEESIYNTPRTVTQHDDQGSEVYDVPSLALTAPSDAQQETYSIPAGIPVSADAEEDVYSVPTLPGLSTGEVPDGPATGPERMEMYCVPTSGQHPAEDQGDVLRPVSDEGVESGCGIYDMPALGLDVSLPSTRRSSVSSTGSGDHQWRTALSTHIQSALAAATTGTPPHELATALTEILSLWKAAQPSEVAPALQQVWSCLSDLLPTLSACGVAPVPDTLLALVRRALEDSASLLHSQAPPPMGRPRLPSQESLSRRPLPALPVAEVKPLSVGMGSRKGSWIQERPLPPPPPPSFPLPPAPPPLTVTDGEELGNEYAGIGLNAAPAPVPAGDSVGYVKLQGKPEPVFQTGNTLPVLESSENNSPPSPPLPVSLSLEDSELLSFYSSQSLSHLSCLADSIDALFSSVQDNHPPRVFVPRGKSLIVTAHKLVFIGDTLSRLLTSPDLKAKVTTSGGHLCQALKAVVVATKGAAQNYPSVPATQEMVDRVAELSQHAACFSGLLKRLAEIS